MSKEGKPQGVLWVRLWPVWHVISSYIYNHRYGNKCPAMPPLPGSGKRRIGWKWHNNLHACQLITKDAQNVQCGGIVAGKRTSGCETKAKDATGTKRKDDDKLQNERSIPRFLPTPCVTPSDLNIVTCVHVTSHGQLNKLAQLGPSRKYVGIKSHFNC